jgi:hypothetical protein
VTDSAFEPGETEVLRHFPVWVDLGLAAVILLAEFAVLSSASDRMAERPLADEQATLVLKIVAALFIGSMLQFVILILPPFVEITDRRILRRRRLGWDDPEELHLDEVESIQQYGWRMAVRGGDRNLEFFCPPFFAPRIYDAIAAATRANEPHSA